MLIIKLWNDLMVQSTGISGIQWTADSALLPNAHCPLISDLRRIVPAVLVVQVGCSDGPEESATEAALDRVVTLGHG